MSSPDTIQEARVREARDQLGMYIEFPIANSESARANAGAWLTEFEAAVRAHERAVILSHDEKVKAFIAALDHTLPSWRAYPALTAALAALEEQTP